MTSDKNVIIYIGPNFKRYAVNENLLFDCVPYIKEKLAEEFKEGELKILELENYSSAVFDKFIDWLYGVGVKCDEQDGWYLHAEDCYIDEEHERLWCELYILAEEFKLEELGKEAVALLEACFSAVRGKTNDVRNDTFSKTTIDYVYDNTIRSSSLRRTIIENVAMHYFSEDKNDHSTTFALLSNNIEAHQDLLDEVGKHITEHYCTFYDTCKLHNKILPEHHEAQKRRE